MLRFDLERVIERRGTRCTLKHSFLVSEVIESCFSSQTEDWQSDKCEVYLLEGTPVRVVTSMLEEASVWVSDSPKSEFHPFDLILGSELSVVR